MILALCTGYTQPYPQFYGLVVIMYVIGHSLCYPMGYDLPSPSLAQSLHPAYAMPPPSIGAPCRPTWCGSPPALWRCKQKDVYLPLVVLHKSHSATYSRVCGLLVLSIGGTSRAGPRQVVICWPGSNASTRVPAICISVVCRTHY
jgi:hypothetical protein